jgi:HlyD family secretion protein
MRPILLGSRLSGGLILIGFFLTACGIQSVSAPRRFDPDQEPTPVPTSADIARPTYEVERGSLVNQITLGGRVVPAIENEISFEMDGEVAEVLVVGADQVTEGQVLARLDTTSFETQRLLAESTLEVAEAQLAAAQTALANNQRRAEISLEMRQLRLDFAIANAGPTLSAAEEFEIAMLRLDVELAELDLSELTSGVNPGLIAQVDQAQLQLAELDRLMANAVLLAPNDGAITRLDLEVGQFVSSQDIVVVIADATRLEIQSFVTESNLRSMVEGMPVQIAFATEPGEFFDGHVGSLPPPYGLGTDLEDGTISIAFADASASQTFSPADRVIVDIVLAESTDTLLLPTVAVREFQSRFFVVVLDGDLQRRVDIEVGIQSDTHYEILSGVSEGETVIGP